MKLYHTENQSFPLTDVGIDAAADFVGDGLEKLGLSRKNALRHRLSTEEVLLHWQTRMGADSFCCCLDRRMGRVMLTLRREGEPADPLSESDGEFDNTLGQQVLANLGLGFTWQYQNSVNIVSVSQKVGRKLSQLTQVLIAAALALGLGFAGQVLPETWRAMAVKNMLEPLFNAFLGLFACIVGPMMFLSMVWSIVNIGDTRKLGRIGGRLLSRFLIISTLFGGFSLVCVLLVLRPALDGVQNGSEVLRSVVEMLLGIVPHNIVDPFRDGNTLQILFLGVIVGIAIIALRDRMQVLTQVVEQSNAAIQFILAAISSMTPTFIFLSVLRLAFQETLLQSFAGLAQAIVLTVTLSMVEILLEVFSLTRLGISPIRAVKKLGSSFLIAVSTASSAAAFPAMMDCCRKKLGIDEKLMNFALPFGSVVFMPHAVALFLVVPLFISQLYGVELTVGSLILCLINAVVLSVAAPPIPGGAVSCFTLMFLQIGIPLEGISLAIAALAVLDFTSTAGQLNALLVQLTHGAHHLGMLDKEILQADKARRTDEER